MEGWLLARRTWGWAWGWGAGSKRGKAKLNWLLPGCTLLKEEEGPCQGG